MNDFDHEALATATPVAEMVKAKLAKYTIKMLADPLDVAALAVFLTGVDTRNVTGQTFIVGGLAPE